MEWAKEFDKAIQYIEDNLDNDISINDIAKKVYISSFYFQRAFSVYTGYSLGEYIRNRRLYKAALELQNGNDKIINIALKYGYETPESFTKAFTKFHGFTPSEIRKKKGIIKIFLPLKINQTIVGGNKMDYKIEKETNLKFIGLKRVIKNEEGYQKCPEFRDEFNEYWRTKINDGSIKSETIKKYCIGAFAICLDDKDCNSFTYYICGRFNGVEIPQGFDVVELPDSLWAKFSCTGPLPEALQTVNTKIWKEWIPNNKEYELSYPADIEFYSSGKVNSPDYHSEIWLPIKPKK